jgi:hypothetical protein
VSESEDGYEQRRYIWPKKKRAFSISYDNLVVSEMNTILNFYNNTASGTYNTFNYTDHVTGETVTCRFADDNINIEEFVYRKFRFSVNLIEVF